LQRIHHCQKEKILNANVENRLKRLRASLSEKNLDTFMVLVAENRHYLSGYTAEDTQFDESAGALFITNSSLILATDSRFTLQAGKEAPLYETVIYKEGLHKQLPDILATLKTERLGYESIRMSCKQYEQILQQIESANLKVKLVPTEDIVENLRVVKEEGEIEALKDALAIAEAVFRDLTATIEPGMTEREVAWLMEKGMRESGAEALSFPTIVASGPNSALPHAIPGDRKFQNGEPVLFDWGAKLKGYCSDISRTLVLGKPDDTFKKVYQTVREAQAKATDAIRAGESSKTVDAIARNHIDAMGFKGKFGHGLGHGAGLAVHEAPRLSPLKDAPLEPGMVCTVEPGIYLPSWGGIRLENMVVVRKDGAEVLNRLDITDYNS
jgi:Xaa-Pro aminopeptidase